MLSWAACRAPLAVNSFAIAASSPVAARSSWRRALAYPPAPASRSPSRSPPSPSRRLPAALTILEPGGGRQALGSQFEAGSACVLFTFRPACVLFTFPHIPSRILRVKL